MPLPDAEPTPNKANIYEQFSHIKVQDFTRENLDVVRKPLNLNAEAEDVLRRILLVGLASNTMSLSGPIPGTQKIEAQTFTSQGYRNYLTPGKDEVFLLMGCSVASVTNLTGSYGIEIDINDGSNRVLLFDYASSSSSDQPVIESGSFSPVYVTYPNTLRLRAEGTFDSVNDVSVLYASVR